MLDIILATLSLPVSVSTAGQHCWMVAVAFGTALVTGTWISQAAAAAKNDVS